MARRRPLCLVAGSIQEVAASDGLAVYPWEKLMCFSHFTNHQGANTSENWNSTVALTGGAVSLVQVTGRPGVVQFADSATAAVSGSYVAQSGIAAKSMYADTVQRAIAAAVAPASALYDATITGVLWAGAANSVTEASVTDCIRIRSLNGGNWTLECKASGVSSTSDLGVAPALGTWVVPEVRFSASSVQAYINGSAAGSPITTNIPTAALVGAVACYKTVATASTQRALRVDWAAFYEP